MVGVDLDDFGGSNLGGIVGEAGEIGVCRRGEMERVKEAELILFDRVLIFFFGLTDVCLFGSCALGLAFCPEITVPTANRAVPSESVTDIVGNRRFGTVLPYRV